MIEWDGNKSKCGRFRVVPFMGRAKLIDDCSPLNPVISFESVEDAKQAAEGIANPLDTGMWFKLIGSGVFVIMIYLACKLIG
jgi:hypothetical protein